MSNAYVSYCRVSTQRQGESGLGLEGQRISINRFLSGVNGTLLGEFLEVESGARNDRPKLQEALALAKRHKATLVIAKLDRLSRNAEFLLGLQNAGVDFMACDMPSADRFTVGILALVAQRERELISQRTKAGLEAARMRAELTAWQSQSNRSRQNRHGEANTDRADAFCGRARCRASASTVEKGACYELARDCPSGV